MNHPVRSKTCDEFLTAKELAARWKLSLRYIHDLQKKGMLKPIYFGRAVRFSLRDILLIEAQGGV